MAKIEINLDAYRLAAECLFRIRQLMRETLKANHGDDWQQRGIPEELLENLQSRRAREASINWHLSDSADLLDYTGFANIYEIIAASDSLGTLFSGLAPDPNVLRIRFLELDTILNRIAYVRPVADTEVGFLVSFDERIRRIAATPAGVRPEPGRTAASKSAPKREAPRASEVEPSEARAPAAVPRPANDPKPEAAQAKAAPPPAADPSPAPDAVPVRSKPPAPAQGDAHLDDALLAGKDGAVLAALYREITSMADGLWTQAAPALPLTWERVRESDWYRDRFTRIGLKAVSDFYSLVDEARERLLAGSSRNDLQEFLKERNFAQVLLSLRELFRHHLAS